MPDAKALAGANLTDFREVVRAVPRNIQKATLSTHSTMTAILPADDTIPQISEGTQILSVSITPKRADCIMRATLTIPMASIAALGNICNALFVNGAANAVRFGVKANNVWLDDLPTLIYEWAPGSTDAQTITARMGPGAAGTVSINGTTSGRYGGGCVAAELIIEEIPQP